MLKHQHFVASSRANKVKLQTQNNNFFFITIHLETDHVFGNSFNSEPITPVHLTTNRDPGCRGGVGQPQNIVCQLFCQNIILPIQTHSCPVFFLHPSDARLDWGNIQSLIQSVNWRIDPGGKYMALTSRFSGKASRLLRRTDR